MKIIIIIIIIMIFAVVLVSQHWCHCHLFMRCLLLLLSWYCWYLLLLSSVIVVFCHLQILCICLMHIIYFYFSLSTCMAMHHKWIKKSIYFDTVAAYVKAYQETRRLSQMCTCFPAIQLVGAQHQYLGVRTRGSEVKATHWHSSSPDSAGIMLRRGRRGGRRRRDSFKRKMVVLGCLWPVFLHYVSVN